VVHLPLIAGINGKIPGAEGIEGLLDLLTGGFAGGQAQDEVGDLVVLVRARTAVEGGR